MKLKDEFIKLPKEIVYDIYISLVYDYKDYDNISRGKMLDSIIMEFDQEKYLYYLCTERELEFLKYAYNNNLNEVDINRYAWEIKELNNKCIFSNVVYEIFEEQRDNVRSALDYFEERNRKPEDDIIIFMITKVKINGNMLTQSLISMVSSLFEIEEDRVEKFLGHPLFKFYCEFSLKYFEFSNSELEIVSYRKYWDLLDDIDELRKEYGISGCLEFDIRDHNDIFYYGFPIRNEKVKLMYDEVNKFRNKEFIFDMIDKARLLNERHNIGWLTKEIKLLEIINDALDEIPCGVMNGFTPNQYKKEKEKEVVLENKFTVIPQNNAHLCKNAADEFYKLYFALLEYTNNKYNVTDKIHKIYKQDGLNVNFLEPIDKYLWKNKNIIDEFIEDNKYNFNENELEKIKEFKNAVTSEKFIVVGFEREYTKILSDDGKLYMVKGVRSDIDELMDTSDLPKIIKTTLLMFDNKIIFNSFFSCVNLVFGNDFKELVLKDLNNAIPYYHL